MKISWSVLLLLKIFSFILLFCSYGCFIYLDVYHMHARAASDQPRAAVMDGCEPSHGAVHPAQVFGESIPSSEPLSRIPSSNPVTLWTVLRSVGRPAASWQMWLAVTFAGYSRVPPLCSQHRLDMAEVLILLPVGLRERRSRNQC